MDRVFSFLLWPKREALGLWKQGRKKRGSITCHTDRANEANKMFIIWFCWLFRFWKGDRELEVRTATYGPGIDQSQHAKSFSHIIITIIIIIIITLNVIATATVTTTSRATNYCHGNLREYFLHVRMSTAWSKGYLGTLESAALHLSCLVRWMLPWDTQTVNRSLNKIYYC